MTTINMTIIDMSSRSGQGERRVELTCASDPASTASIAAYFAARQRRTPVPGSGGQEIGRAHV